METPTTFGLRDDAAQLPSSPPHPRTSPCLSPSQGCFELCPTCRHAPHYSRSECIAASRDERPVIAEAKGDNDDGVDDNRKGSNWDATCGWRSAVRTADVVKWNGEEKWSARVVGCDARLAAQVQCLPCVCMSQEKGVVGLEHRG